MDPATQNPSPIPVPTPPQAAAPAPSYQPPSMASPLTALPHTQAPSFAAPNTAATPTRVLPAAQANPNSTQNTLQIAEIRDGIVIMNDGSFRSVVMVKSINFDLMSPAEQEGVEAGYQAFLNALYFPVQIFVRSQKVDLGPYIQRLDKIRTEHDNMLLAMLMEDYIGFMSDLASQTNIMDKKFYVVIPYYPVEEIKKALTSSKNLFSGISALFSHKEDHVIVDEAVLEQAKTELRNRVQAVLGGLMQCSVQGLPLDTQELIELYYGTYNPDTATRQKLKNFDDLSAPVITKGQGFARQPSLERSLE